MERLSIEEFVGDQYRARGEFGLIADSENTCPGKQRRHASEMRLAGFGADFNERVRREITN